MAQETTSKKPAPKLTHEKAENTKEPDSKKAKEFGGTKGLEPTRYGDWEHNGRCTDF